MLLQMSRQARVEVALRDDDELKPLQGALIPSPASVDVPVPLSEMEEAAFLAQGSTLSIEEYNHLGQYLMSTERPYHSVHSIQEMAAATLEAPFPSSVRA